MGYGIIDTSTLTNIANAIREKLGVQTQYKPGEMPEAIESISGGGITPTGTKQVSITDNGTTTEDVTVYANAQISVNVVNQDYVTALVALGVTEDLTDSIEALTTYANGVTGESDTNLSDAVASLADGYGQGGSGVSQGIEIVTDANGKITNFVFHGLTEIPSFALNYTGYNRNGATDGYPTISFADKPTSLANRAISLACAYVDVSGLSELEKVAGEYGLTFSYNAILDYSNVVYNLPKFRGYVDNTYSAMSVFRANQTQAPKTYILPVCEVIPQYAWYGSKVTGLSITIGSVGHAVTGCMTSPFGSSSNASGTVTIYTDGSHLDTVKTSVQNGAGSNLTFVYKAAEATTYGGVSYSAGDTITV